MNTPTDYIDALIRLVERHTLARIQCINTEDEGACQTYSLLARQICALRNKIAELAVCDCKTKEGLAPGKIVTIGGGK